MINSLRFSAMNTLTLKDLPDRLASSGNSLLSMVMQLSMSLGVSVAGILIGSFAHHRGGRQPGHPQRIYLQLLLYGVDYRSARTGLRARAGR